MTDQWYVDAKTLAGPAIEAVRSGKTKFVPGNWEKTYYQWMENIQPWCISRQLWWGHQIPAWYGPDGTVYVAESEEEAQAQAGEGVALTRDEDVLDTWFSSALWPFSTLGWPEDTPDVKRFYPTATLVTAFDIIFFWVARMMMSGLHFMNEVPFKDVYITSLVRDEKGDKMSKSKGNVIDPLDFINKYGADALRFTMASLETQGRDIKLSESRVEGYRNFGTKLWNAARFCEMNGIGGSRDLTPPPATLSVNRWIIGEIGKAAELVTKSLEAFRFDAAANAIYHFTWGTFCDWYLELIKPTLMGKDGAEKDETRAVAGWVLDQILVLLHPFMPFITEELWHALYEGDRDDLIEARWPVVRADAVDAEADAELTWIVDLISATRSARSEANIPAGAKVSVLVQETREERLLWLARNGDLILRLGRLASITPTEYLPNKGAVQFVMDGASFAIPLEGVIDLGEERARLDKAIAKTEKEINALSGRLSNEKFVANAPDEVVAEARNRLEQERDQLEKLKAAKARLG
ncbi:hypothetical protein JCM17843_20540 [Kordiimonadales bacterium JCM 17843]|nr:hypothetical protein JCM17843_20540 [Kordiimonadales bacterium JCM 17843]